MSRTTAAFDEQDDGCCCCLAQGTPRKYLYRTYPFTPSSPPLRHIGGRRSELLKTEQEKKQSPDRPQQAILNSSNISGNTELIKASQTLKRKRITKMPLLTLFVTSLKNYKSLEICRKIDYGLKILDLPICSPWTFRENHSPNIIYIVNRRNQPTAMDLYFLDWVRTRYKTEPETHTKSAHTVL